MDAAVGRTIPSDAASENEVDGEVEVSANCRALPCHEGAVAHVPIPVIVLIPFVNIVGSLIDHFLGSDAKKQGFDFRSLNGKVTRKPRLEGH